MLQVGYDLTANLPGHFGMISLEVIGGSNNVSVISGQSSLINAGLFIAVDQQTYEISAFDPATQTIELTEVNAQDEGSKVGCRYLHPNYQNTSEFRCCSHHLNLLRSNVALLCIVDSMDVACSLVPVRFVLHDETYASGTLYVYLELVECTMTPLIIRR